MDSLTHEILDDIQSVAVDERRAEPVKIIDYITAEISYRDFLLKYLLPNRPCLFASFVTTKWKSVKEWARQDGQPDLEFLAANFGDAVVPVADCNKVQYYAQPKTEMTLVDYIKYWKNHISKDHQSDEGCLYLKDWHFAHVFADYEAYKTPVYFTSDWLNEFWDSRLDRKDDDYRFVYMGPKGSWTPFHADVFRSFSWSANICGRKRWLLFPPGEEQHLKDHLGNLPYDVTSSELHDGKKYPNYGKACQPFEVVQEAGEIIFVPSGWHHQVFNVKDTISINHNWLNGCNVDIMWEFLEQELCTVQKSISDCKDMDGWDSQCQLIMKASTGIDYAEFFHFLHIIASQRLAILSQCVQQACNQDIDSWSPNPGQTNFDIPGLGEQSISLLNCKQQTKPKDSNSLTESTGTASPAGEKVNSAETISVADFVHHHNVSSKSCQSLPEESNKTQGSVWHLLFDINQIRKVLECLMKNKEFKELESSIFCDDPRQLYSSICDVLREYQRLK